jgi:hypothetical protein
VRDGGCKAASVPAFPLVTLPQSGGDTFGSYLSSPLRGILLSACLGGQVWKGLGNYCCLLVWEAKFGRGLEIGEVGPLTLQHLLPNR